MENNHYPFVNPPLPYDYNAMEPFIDTKTMTLHHDKHLQTYVDNLNSVLKDNPKLQNLSLEELIYSSGRLSRNIQDKVRNNAGGVYNHIFFFDEIKNPSSNIPTGNIAQIIDQQFGSYDNFKDELKKTALSVFGSGYAWLVLDRGKLRIIATQNQNNPIEYKMCPILTLDVWEHSYYLKHYNKRFDYIDDWFKIIDWDKINRNLSSCMRA